MFSLFWSRGTGLGSGLLFHLFPDVDFAPHGIYSMIGAVAVLASFKQMSFLAHLMRWKSHFLCLQHGSVSWAFDSHSWLLVCCSLRSRFRCFFRNAVLVGFFVDSASCCRGAVNSFPTPFADKHGIICHGPWQNVCHKTCLIVCLEIEWNWGNPRNCEIFYKNHVNETHVWSIRIGEVFQFSGPNKKNCQKYRYPPPWLHLLWSWPHAL